jgi:hypothetical protein
MSSLQVGLQRLVALPRRNWQMADSDNPRWIVIFGKAAGVLHNTESSTWEQYHGAAHPLYP